jgi:hypothetical protein
MRNASRAAVELYGSVSTGDGRLDVGDLVEMFEASEEATYEARKLAERDRDYVDNIQLTAAELKVLKDRKQPPIIINRIKRKVDFLKGFELNQRVDPRALPRTPRHEDDADAASQALRYVAEGENFDYKRSCVWDNMLVEGSGGYSVSVKPKKNGEIEIKVNHIPWDRMGADPHARAPDYSDAKYLFVVKWMDFDEAADEYPDAIDALETTLNGVSISETYDDRPAFRVWADKKRKRVRIVQIWIDKRDEWHFAEFTKGGILKAGPSPYVKDDGESDCELIFGSAYVNRENERYGLVREMIDPQDEINARRSKSLHLLNTAQLVYEDGAIDEVEPFRRQMARPDGVMKINHGFSDRIKFETRQDLAAGHMTLLQEAKNEIDMMAGNIALQGNALQKSASTSGKAIIASQQGGAMEIAPLLDALRHLDIRVYRAVWARIRQFWTAEKWVRVTDDEKNIKWLGLNVDPARLEAAKQQNPAIGDQVAGVVGNVAELDVDIIIDDAPDGLTPQLEQFQALVELKKMDANGELPFRAIMLAMPNLKNKDKILAAMEEAKNGGGSPEEAQARQAAAEQQQAIAQRATMLQLAQGEAKVEDTRAAAQLKAAQAAKAIREAQVPAQSAPQQDEQPSIEMAVIEIEQAAADVEDTRAGVTLKRAQAEQVMLETAMTPHRMEMEMAKDAHDADAADEDRRVRAEAQQRSFERPSLPR